MPARCCAAWVCHSGQLSREIAAWDGTNRFEEVFKKLTIGSKMATTAKRVKDKRKPKFSSRQHNRCNLCGRPRAFLRKFGICRLCFRSLALKGEIPGVMKSSW